MVCFCTSIECSHQIWNHKRIFKIRNYMQKLLQAGSELSDTFPGALQIYLAQAVHLLVPCVFFFLALLYFV